MKILHTSDWHLGRSLYGRKRYEEFTAFLEWLVHTIEEEKVDVLLVAGDVFDTTTPSNRAQGLYYRFLCRVADSCCRHVVVIGGNHDSPSFLNAPRELLRTLNVHVVGAVGDSLEDEVIVLYNGGRPEALVCAVPYLRDKDIRRVEPGETIDDKNRKLVEGIKEHYGKVVSLAQEKCRSISQTTMDSESRGPQPKPFMIGMGHLFTTGGKTIDGDGVRELYVGSLAHVGVEIFPASLDYLALGHLHVPQMVGGAEHIRYSGSPIPMGYGEANQEKKVVLVELEEDSSPKIQELSVPCFQELVRIAGTLDEILARVEELKGQQSSAWLEIEYTGKDIVGNLSQVIGDAVADSAMEIRRIKNRRVMEGIIKRAAEEETLDDLDADDVFVRCLDAFEVPHEDRAELTETYNEILMDLEGDDRNAE